MVTQRLRLAQSETAPERVVSADLRDMRPLGQILVEMQAISEDDLDHGLKQQRRVDAPLGDILVSEGLLESEHLQNALADQFALRKVDFTTDPPNPRSAHLLTGSFCVRYSVIPWLQLDDVLLVATARPDQFDEVAEKAPNYGLTLLPVLAEHDQIHVELRKAYGTALARRAEIRVDETLSCRNWGQNARLRLRWMGTLATLLLTAALLAPGSFMAALTALATVTLIMVLALKIAAAGAELIGSAREAPGPTSDTPAIMRLPKISIMVPLLRETEIATALLRRLSSLTYPKAQLDVVLVLEEDDRITRDTLARTVLPAWMRVIEVPASDGLLTKPRALNYAMDFCKGSIIGVWDAEDAPMPGQLEEVVTRFHTAPRNVACLQGRLDYYNPKSNWLARCFTIEYATWWRLIMPGLERLGCVIPLGGTTLFFRREVLEKLGGWDAHNVTEDADLGLRLARRGYKTELIDTTTFEEANNRAWPWVKQRSRWLKGFAITWAVHMRSPSALARDLGLYRFVMLQVFFLTALSQFMLAPVFWSFGLLALGLPHPAADWTMLGGLLAFFVCAELCTLALHLIGTRARSHRHLRPWAPTMILYFPLATLAMYKALYELIARPFYWDKTQHGVCKTVTYNLTNRLPGQD